MTWQTAKSMFLSLEVPEDSFTCLVPWNGKSALAAFARAYGSNVIVTSEIGTLIENGSPDDAIKILEPLHGVSLLVNFLSGGEVFVDFNDDSSVFVLPSRCRDTLRSSVDVARAYREAERRQTMFDDAALDRAEIRKLKELLAFAIKN